jgi:RimJ/RimL family protein N-acetyltransferase
MCDQLGNMPLLSLLEQNNLQLDGDKVYLRPLGNADISEQYLRWLNDEQINRYSERRGKNYTLKDLHNYIDEANTSFNLLQLGIFISQDSSHVGNISLRITNIGARVAEVATLIGETDYWGRGIIVDAAKTLIHFAFQKIKLRKITLGNYSLNRASTFKSKQLGATLEGRFRESALINGEYVDTLEFGLFPENFYQKFPELLENASRA